MSSSYNGMAKPELQELPPLKDRYSFLYLQYCKVSRSDSAIKVLDEKGAVFIPAAMITVLLLGPGTTISHRAMELVCDMGISFVWVGEMGVRCYASGRPLTHRSTLLLKQAELVTNQRTHLDVVRKMYSLRFPDEDISKLSTQQLRGKEGARVRKQYKDQAEKWGVEWKGRNYNVEDFHAGDLVNQSLSAGNVCLYGMAHTVICALGCSPGLGFVHVGHEKSFVYDLADLYKAEITIPIAFELASQNTIDIETVTRKKVRDAMHEKKILERMVKDLHYLLSEYQTMDDFEDNSPEIYLWDSQYSLMESGRAYT